MRTSRARWTAVLAAGTMLAAVAVLPAVAQPPEDPPGAPAPTEPPAEPPPDPPADPPPAPPDPPTPTPPPTSPQPPVPKPSTSKPSTPAPGGPVAGPTPVPASPGPPTAVPPGSAPGPGTRDAEGRDRTRAAADAGPSHDDLAEADAAVLAARAALEAAQAALAGARSVAEDAQARLEETRAEDERLRRRLAAAEQAEQRAERQLETVLERMEATREDLGAIARQAYRGATFATLSVVLSSGTPSEFADRYAGLQAVLRAGDSALGALAVDHAELADSEERLRAARELAQRLKRESEAALVAAVAAEQTARDAQRHLAELLGLREDALLAAQQARLADYERYQEFLAQSTALAPAILHWASQLRDGAGVVAGSGQLVRPGTGAVTSRFGPRLHPILGYVKQHTGTDLSRGDGYVYAADAGTVVTAGSHRAYGTMTVIDHGTFGGSQLATLYAHQASLLVRVGDRVARGQRIGVIGSTGYSTGPHLHFEVRLDGHAVDPWPWIAGAGLPTG